MSKQDSNKPAEPKTAEEAIARGGVQVSKLKPDTRLIIETSTGTMYTVSLVDEFTGLIQFYSTDPRFRTRPPVHCYFVASWMDREGKLSVPDWIVKLGRMQFRFRDGHVLTAPVIGATVEGNGWHYEVIK